MKQIKFLAAALAALTMLSCSKDGSKGPDDGSSSTGRTVTINFANMANSGRSIGNPSTGTNNKATISDAGIYFVTATDAVVMSRPVVEAELGAAILCTNVPNNATKVYVVANYIKSVAGTVAYPIVTDDTRLSLNALKKKFTGITAKSQSTIADMMMDGIAAVVPTTVENVTTYSATVAISPLVARIELSKFTLKNTGTGNIESYNLEGVFVNNVYQNFDLSAEVGNNTLLSSGTGPFEEGEGNGEDGFHPSWFKDWSAAGFIKGTGLETLPQAANGAWGYNIFPAKKSADEKINLLPQLIFRINNVVVNGLAPTTVPRYATVMKFKNIDGGAEVATFARNKCYTITNVTMDYETSSTDPEVAVIEITVTVTISDWAIVPIEPA